MAKRPAWATLMTVVTTKRVSLVIPGRDCAGTVGECLAALVPLLDGPHLGEIIFVDDGSTDGTVDIVQHYPVTLVRGAGQGAGAARNQGIACAKYELIWFVDSDCVSEPDALAMLLPHLDDPKVGGVGGSYANCVPDSWLACLIHEEIVERHRSMPAKVNFLATFNVVYRRCVLEAVHGFDVRFLKGQDAELSFRVMEAGYELRFDRRSRVGHYHETSLRRYLRIQRQQGFWRVRLHLSHRGHAVGDSYSNWVDHVQPLLGLLTLAAAPLSLMPKLAWIPGVVFAMLAVATIPMTLRLLRRLREPKYVLYAWMSMVRALWRGIGLTGGVVACTRDYLRGAGR